MTAVFYKLQPVRRGHAYFDALYYRCFLFEQDVFLHNLDSFSEADRTILTAALLPALLEILYCTMNIRNNSGFKNAAAGILHFRGDILFF